MADNTSNAIEFTAKGRIPCRPLTYENKSLAMPKELLCDYETGEIYLCKSDGSVVNISDAIKEAIMADPDFAQDITVTLPDGTVISLESMVINTTNDLTELKDALGYTKDPETGEISFKLLDQFVTKDPETGELKINVKPEDIVTDDTHQFATAIEKSQWNNARHDETIYATIPTTGWQDGGDEAPFIQEVNVSGILATDAPIVDIYLNGLLYEDIQKKLDAWALVFRIVTFDDKIKVYATEETEDEFTIQMKVQRA